MVLATIDWTVIATGLMTLVGTLVGLFLGYWTGRESQRAAEARRKAQQEKEQTDATSRLYGSFLEVDRHLDVLVRTPITKENFYQWVDDYNKCYEAILLLGSKSVASCVAAYGPIPPALYSRLEDSPNFDQDLTNAYTRSQDERTRARQELVDAMRVEIAPDRKPIRWGDPRLPPMPLTTEPTSAPATASTESQPPSGTSEQDESPPTK